MMQIYGPKKLTKSFILEFLRKFNNTFGLEGKQIKKVSIFLGDVIEIDMLGILVLYKYLDTAVHKKFFFEPILDTSSVINEGWIKFGFREWIGELYANRPLSDEMYAKLEAESNKTFFIAPQALFQNSNDSKDFLVDNFYPIINEYYKDNEKKIELIFSCFAEISLNFLRHTENKERSIIIASGNANKIEIGCVDSGVGIISSLKKVLSDSFSDDLILSKAVENKVTSKPKTNHMGFGLWMIDQLTKINYGQLHIYSQGYYYYNNFGQIKTGKSGYWQGTIIYLNLSLNNPKTLSDIKMKENSLINNLKVNFL